MIGQLVGTYRVMTKIGEGGMGAVFEAVDEKIGKHVAIKVLLQEHATNPTVATRFINEARAINVVDHPGVVQVSAFGHLPDGTAYIVMELLKGQTLNARLKAQGGRFAVPTVLQLGRQLASALAAAHGKGIIHRDLKPDNVMIVADSSFPGGERTKLLDFGIAKLRLEYQGEGEQIQTRAGVMMGTPLYMSPEQCRNASDVDDKADVYSLGIIVYRMLAGRPPFNAAGTGELMAMHIYKQPPPLAEADASLPEPLTQLVHRMLAKNRTERPSMAEVAQELDRIGTVSMSLPVVPSRSSLPTVPATDDGATVVSDPSSAQRTPTPAPSASGAGTATSPASRTPARRSPLVSLAVSVVLLALIGGIYLWVSHRRTPKDATNQMSTPADAGAPPDASDAAPPQKLVHWQIESSPAGAEVIRIDDNKSQGQTPLRIEQPAQPGEVKLELRLKGYAPLPFAISGEEDAKPAVFNLVAEKAGKRVKKPRGPKPPAQ